MNKRNVILVTLLAGSLVAVGIAGASPFGSCDRGFRTERMGFGHQRHDPVQRLMRHLDLSADQQAQIRDIVAESRDAAAEQRAALRDTRRALHELAVASDYDAARVRELAQEQAQIKADLTVARIETMQRIHQMLTPEQQSQVADLLEQRRGKWEAWQERRDAE